MDYEEKAYYEYENTEKGIDYDLAACLHYNPQEGFGLSDIDKVLAVHPGENDENSWHWIIQLTKKRLVYLEGGCDYTGWDCQSSASSKFIDKPEDALNLVGKVSTWANSEVEIVRQSLLNQLATTKSKTWRERMNKEFNLS